MREALNVSPSLVLEFSSSSTSPHCLLPGVRLCLALSGIMLKTYLLPLLLLSCCVAIVEALCGSFASLGLCFFGSKMTAGLSLISPPPCSSTLWPTTCVCCTAETTGRSPHALSWGTGAGLNPGATHMGCLQHLLMVLGARKREAARRGVGGSLWTVVAPRNSPGLTRMEWED